MDQEILDRCPDVQILGNNDQTWARVRLNKALEVCSHGPAIVRDRDTTELSRFLKDLRIRNTYEAALVGILEVDRRFAASQAQNNLVVDVRVGLKTWSHSLVLGAPWRAASNFA